MMFNGVLTGKLHALDQVLAELESLGQVNAARLEEDWLVRRAVERDLQVLVEVIIDVCHRIISLEGQGPATGGVDAIKRCIDKGILTKSDVYPEMVRFRNFLVHRYESVDVNILASLVSNHLLDFYRFREEIVAYVAQKDDEEN
jgi:uncharacterized protein YutE (UPF0331/DUF86 family)